MEKEESKLFYTQNLKQPIRTDGTSDRFKEDDYFFGSHIQDCCEIVEIDISNSDLYKKQIKPGMTVNKLEYRTCPGDGFLIKLYHDLPWYEINDYIGHIYYPCYNSQNGFYSDQLDIIIKEQVSISLNDLGCVKDYI